MDKFNFFGIICLVIIFFGIGWFGNEVYNEKIVGMKGVDDEN